MAESRIERVARAIYAEWARDSGKAESWEDLVCLGHSFVELAHKEARAAIKAMGNPNDAMVDAAGGELVPAGDFIPAYCAAIGAALNEQVAA